MIHKADVSCWQWKPISPKAIQIFFVQPCLHDHHPGSPMACWQMKNPMMSHGSSGFQRVRNGLSSWALTMMCPGMADGSRFMVLLLVISMGHWWFLWDEKHSLKGDLLVLRTGIWGHKRTPIAGGFIHGKPVYQWMRIMAAPPFSYVLRIDQASNLGLRQEGTDCEASKTWQKPLGRVGFGSIESIGDDVPWSI